MCMVTKPEIPIKTAEEDIVCYKKFCHTYGEIERRDSSKPLVLTSYYEYYKYRIGETYKEDTYLKGIKRYIPTTVIEVTKGFHSYVLPPSTDMVVAKCIIPKGSEYREGWDNDLGGQACYVSNAIKVVEIIEITEKK